uniref:Uncharacterized protein n=1 Tax=Alexandrium monilatum TaxID=311494 RepID=A0A7S4UX91_9DINO
MARSGGAEASGYAEMQTHEVAYAQMETRLRNMISELLQPTVQRTSVIVSDVDGLKNVVAQHTRGLQEVQLGQFKAAEQVSTITTFREEMGRWDTQRRKHEASIDEKVEAVQQRMEAFRYNLEQKESALHHLHRSVDRLALELNHTQEEQESQRNHFETRMDDQSRRVNQFKSEVDVCTAGLQLRHTALSDELWGEMTGLAKVVGELKKTNVAFQGLEDAVSELQQGKAEAAQLDKLRAEVQRMVHEANAAVASMKQTVGSVVNEVREHFRTASQTIAAHNATFVGEVRSEYQAELANAARLRDEVKDFVAHTEDGIAGLDARVAEAAARADALAAEARGEVEELNRRRKRDKTSSDNEFKALKRRLEGVFGDSGMVLRGIEHIYGVLQQVLQSDLIGCSVDLQDSIDRRRIALWGGVSSDDGSLHRSRQLEPQRPRPECQGKSGTAPARMGGGGGPLRGGPGGGAPPPAPRAPPVRGEPNVRVEPRCLSCSGQAPLVLSAFKMACLQYAPSPVEHDGHQHERDDLLRRRQRLLQGAHSALLEGPLAARAEGAAVGGAAPLAEAAVQEVAAEDRLSGEGTLLAEYAAAEARLQLPSSRASSAVRLPNLAAAPPVMPMPRAVTAR